LQELRNLLQVIKQIDAFNDLKEKSKIKLKQANDKYSKLMYGNSATSSNEMRQQELGLKK
jgi:division protein CdvB (Snf7/Vps24/ESCRT-III family)